MSDGELHRKWTLGKDFSDSVILLHHFDDTNGSGVAELCEPANAEGRAMPTGMQVPITFDGRGKEAHRNYWQPVIKAYFYRRRYDKSRMSWTLVCVLAWSPIPDA